MKPDEQLQCDVLAELQNHPGLDTTHICIDAKDGVLVLSGAVDTLSEKLDLERIAQAASGVMAFSSNIFVMQPGLSHRSDKDIALAAENVLRWMSFAPTHPIQVEVQSGIVTLTGKLELDYQRRAALGAVRHLVGVSGICDRIVVDVQQAVKAHPLALGLALLLSTAAPPDASMPRAA